MPAENKPWSTKTENQNLEYSTESNDTVTYNK